MWAYTRDGPRRGWWESVILIMCMWAMRSGKSWNCSFMSVGLLRWIRRQVLPMASFATEAANFCVISVDEETTSCGIRAAEISCGVAAIRGGPKPCVDTCAKPLVVFRRLPMPAPSRWTGSTLSSSGNVKVSIRPVPGPPEMQRSCFGMPPATDCWVRGRLKIARYCLGGHVYCCDAFSRPIHFSSAFV